MSITHKKVSAVIQGIDPSLVRPSDWNDSHEIKEAGGQALTLGSIPDLTILKRSGTAITGAAVDSANTASAVVVRDSSGNFTAGIITASLTGNASGSSGTCTGNAGSSTYASNTTITDDAATAATMYPTWVTATTGNLPQKTSSTKLTFNPSTGMLTATGFTGAFTGNAGSSTYATNTTITDDIATAATMYPTWVTATTGNLPQKTSSTKLTFNPSTGMLTATGFTGALTGNASGSSGTCTGNAGSSTYASNTTITDDAATAATMYPTWVTATTGNLPQKTSSTKLTFNPSTGMLTATGFTGALTGNASGSSGTCTGNAGSSTYASNTTITDDVATAATMYLTWVTATTGNLPQKTSSTKLTFNPSTGMLTATGFTGAWTGNAASSTYASNITITDDAATAATMYPTWVTATTGNLPQKTSSTKLTFNPSTGMLTATGFTGALTGNASGSSGTCTGNAGSSTYASNTTITDDIATAATMYPTWVTATTGNLPQKTSSTKLTFNPSTGMLTATGFTGALTGTASGNYAPSGTDIPVADGGTGRSVTVAYTPICGGTTTTAAMQSVDATGMATTGYVLTSNGASALPTFQAATGGGSSTAAVWLGAEAAYLPATNPAVFNEVAGVTTYGGWSYLAFDDTTAQTCIWRVPLPDYNNGNIVVTAYSKPQTTPAGAKTLQYNIFTIGVTDNEDFDAAVLTDTTVNISHTLGTGTLSTEVHKASGTIDPANLATDDMLLIGIQRDVSTDDLVGNGQLLGILIEYVKS